MSKFAINNGDPTNRLTKVGKCIYCGAAAIGEEHIIPAGLGGTLVLDLASCRECETAVNAFESNVLKTVLYVPRVALKLRRKRRKRTTQDRLSVHATIDGQDVPIELPVEDHPAMFFLVRLDPPDFLLGKPPGGHGLRIPGAWVCPVRPGGFSLPKVKGLRSIASPVMDTHNFARFLAKIAHGFAVYMLGLDGFSPMLPDYIRHGGPADKVGGEIIVSSKSDNLHELSLEYWPLGSERFAVVRIRLFANLGSPTFLVVAGKAKAS